MKEWAPNPGPEPFKLNPISSAPCLSHASMFRGLGFRVWGSGALILPIVGSRKPYNT